MRESISITTIFQIFILFILLFTAIMCLTINNSNAFGVKDSIVNAIEGLDGNYLDGPNLNEEIVKVIQETSYRTSGTCPDDYKGFDRAGNAVSSGSSDAAVCIKEVQATKGLDDYLSSPSGGGLGNTVAVDDFVEGSYYKVMLFFQLDIPVIKQIFNFNTTGETRIIYNTTEQSEPATDVKHDKYANKGNLAGKPTEQGDDSAVNPVRNPGTIISSGNNSSNKEPEQVEEEKETTSTCDFSNLEMDKTLKNMGGVALFNADIYSTDGSSKLGIAEAGVIFKIQGEVNGQWAIDYNNGEICGLVKTTNLAINIKDYISEASYNITNASSSIYVTSGESIPDLTGQKLYSSEFSEFVPLTYSFAKIVKKAAQNAASGGDRLVIYDAYRPKSVSNYAYNKFVALLNSRADLNYYVNTTFLQSNFKTSSFLAQYSVHNRGCAVDVQLASGMDSRLKMHELSVVSARYQTKDLSSVKRLTDYFTRAGATTISSEWWHFQGTCTVSDSADIWSAVS